MNRLIKIPVVLGFMLCAAPVMAEDDHGGGLKSFNIQAGDFSDAAVLAASGESCAHFLKVMLDDEGYKLLSTVGVQGPPGVVYTLQNHKGEIAIIKCRAGGCDHGDEGGH